jgi:hypothetical protein
MAVPEEQAARAVLAVRDGATLFPRNALAAAVAVKAAAARMAH